jgi:uncharacterized protein (TIGR04255 family)
MGSPTHLRNAPITEAILDIQTVYKEAPSLDSLKLFQEPIKSRYPLEQKRVTGSFEVKFVKGAATVIQSPGLNDGYMFSSDDRKQIVQARIDGFAFSRLKPYTSWETFLPEAKELWKRYLEVVPDGVVTRLALRYINRMEIPLDKEGIGNYSEYIKTHPVLAPGLPENYTGLFMRLVIPVPKSSATANITQTLEPVTSLFVPLIFDIDVFRQMECPLNNEDIWGCFDELHSLKNEFFFRSITDKAMEQYK